MWVHLNIADDEAEEKAERAAAEGDGDKEEADDAAAINAKSVSS